MVDHKHCRGCGAVFQFEQQGKEGYVDLTRLDKGLEKRQSETNPDLSHVLRSLISERRGSGGLANKLRAVGQPVGQSLLDTAEPSQEEQSAKTQAKEQLEDGHSEMYSVDDYLEDTIGLENIKEVEDLFEDKIVQKDICDRCVHLKSGDLDKVRSVEINLESSFLISRDPCDPLRDEPVPEDSQGLDCHRGCGCV